MKRKLLGWGLIYKITGEMELEIYKTRRLAKAVIGPHYRIVRVELRQVKP